MDLNCKNNWIDIVEKIVQIFIAFITTPNIWNLDMADIRIIIRFSVLIIALCFVLFVTACNKLFDNIVWPKNKIISLYESPNIDSYKIRSVVLLPMIPDDTTDAGTFYSTNHFIKGGSKNFNIICGLCVFFAFSALNYYKG